MQETISCRICLQLLIMIDKLDIVYIINSKGYGGKSLPLESKKLALRIGSILKEKKAEDVVLLEVYPLTVIADYFVIASGRSQIQINALYDELTEEISNEGIELKGTDGGKTSGWIALDYGDVIVHILKTDERKFYDLERLWADARAEIIQ